MGEGVGVLVEDFSPGCVVLDFVSDEHSELIGHGEWYANVDSGIRQMGFFFVMELRIRYAGCIS